MTDTKIAEYLIKQGPEFLTSVLNGMDEEANKMLARITKLEAQVAALLAAVPSANTKEG